MADWDSYQEDVAAFFRSIGLDADTNVALRGVRTSHDVDVVIRSEHVGFNLLWIVECKCWQKPVSKLHVLGLREIVSDIGADRGIMMAENGYQSGAREAANLTNVQLTSLLELKDSASYALGIANLRNMQDRIDLCNTRYWNLDKEFRIDNDLRPALAFDGYRSVEVIEVVSAATASAFRGIFPPVYDHVKIGWIFGEQLTRDVKSPIDLFIRLEPMVLDLENRLDRAYAALEGIPDADEE